MDNLVTLDPNKCISCALCNRVCPMQLEIFNKVNNESYQLENPDCIRCGLCIENCPMQALSFKPKQGKVNFIKKLSLVKIKEINNPYKNIRELTITFKNNHNALPGQFINILLDKDKNIFRAYSISKIITKKSLRITIKKVEDGLLSPLIFNLNKGDSLNVEGPMGDEFVIRKNNKNLCFVGIGIGITPFVELLTSVIKSKKITLFHGAKYESELYYKSFFETLEKKHKNFTYIPIVSREKFKNQGRVTDFIKNYDLTNYDFYVCGKKDLINDLIKIKDLKKHKNLFFEVF